jgi:MFS family permease
MPDLVPREEIPGAVALGSAQWNLGRVVGPALAGLVIQFGGYEWAFAVNTVSFLAVIAAIAPLRLPPPTPHGGESVLGSIANGARFSVHEPGIRALMTYLALNSLLAAPFIGLVAAFALKVFHNENPGTGILITAQGVGAVLMALMLGGLGMRYGHRRVLLTAITALPVTLVLYALAPNLALGAVAIFLVGYVYLGCLSGFVTIAQLRAPAELRGRVMSALMVLLGLLYPLGAITQGAIADEIGLRATTAGAAVLLALAFIALRTFRPGFDRDLRDPEIAPADLSSGAATATPATPA